MPEDLCGGGGEEAGQSLGRRAQSSLMERRARSVQAATEVDSRGLSLMQSSGSAWLCPRSVQRWGRQRRGWEAEERVAEERVGGANRGVGAEGDDQYEQRLELREGRVPGPDNRRHLGRVDLQSQRTVTGHRNISGCASSSDELCRTKTKGRSDGELFGASPSHLVCPQHADPLLETRLPIHELYDSDALHPPSPKPFQPARRAVHRVQSALRGLCSQRCCAVNTAVQRVLPTACCQRLGRSRAVCAGLCVQRLACMTSVSVLSRPSW